MTEPIEIVTEAGTIAELAEAACAPALVAKAAFEAELARIEQHAPFVLINGQA